MLVDTHCHIHEPDYPLPLAETIAQALEADVNELICIGTSEASSRQAIDFAEANDSVWAAIGVHPHDTKDGHDEVSRLAGTSKKIVAVGEIGLDYFYAHSERKVQMHALEAQIKVALAHDLPIIFHVREAFDDFWPIFDKYPGIRGELHSFTDSQANLEMALTRGLYIGVNGISTFTKDSSQLAMFDAIPLDRILFETDAPFLTPVPFRGKVNQPAFVRNVAEFHAKRRDLSLQDIADASTANAHMLFALSN